MATRAVRRRPASLLLKDVYRLAPILLFLLLVLITGGSARGDVQSLILLRPLAALFLCYGLIGLTSDDVASLRTSFAITLAIILLILLHLVPLPPAIWTALPGRDVVVGVDRAAGIGAIWRPLSLVPTETRNALFSMIVPLAALVLVARLDPGERHRLLWPLLGIGMASGVLGFLQAVGPQGGPLYFYRVTNGWSAVGFFANRNHQALLLAAMFPVLAVYASIGIKTEREKRIRSFTAIAAGVLIVPLLLVTGSRAGLALGVLGIAVTPLLMMQSQRLAPDKRGTRRIKMIYVLGPIGLVGLAILGVVFARAEAISRMISGTSGPEVRFEVWPTVIDLIQRFLPFGSGIGSFVPVFQLEENTRDMRWFYMNHAHNELLEIALTGGLPAIAILLVATVAWGRMAMRWFRTRPDTTEVVFGRLGVILIAMYALASLVDYPIRVPLHAAIFTIAVAWACGDPVLRSTGYVAKKTGPL